MLVELHVSQLGVVEDLTLVFGDGMTAVTGETGAGKTLLIEAIRLLLGGKAESHVVRTGAAEATVEGRFVSGDIEQVLRRVIPADGRSRAYLNGQMVPLSVLGEIGQSLVDLYGQHAHQSLFSSVAQRKVLDLFGDIDISLLSAAKSRISQIKSELDSMGGDAQTRAREVDLLRYQLEELNAAELNDPEEDDRLRDEVDVLADATEHRFAATSVHEELSAEGGVVDHIAAAIKAASGRGPLAQIEQRLVALVAEIDDISLEANAAIGQLQDDPERLEWVQKRRQTIKQLQRKYGATLADVITFRDETRNRLETLEQHDELVKEFEQQLALAVVELESAQQKVRKERTATAPKLAKEVQRWLRTLALPNARFEIQVAAHMLPRTTHGVMKTDRKSVYAPEQGAGDDVVFLLGPNPGMPVLPLAKAASGGELARSMLALRLALLKSPNEAPQHPRWNENGQVNLQEKETPGVLIFDEVDAGIGGEAAVAVGHALAALAHGGAAPSQVLVVTHLPQVAAFADHQVSVAKEQNKNKTITQIQVLDITERETELARMLSGRPGSDSGRAHARELLEQAVGARNSIKSDGKGKSQSESERK